MENIQCTTDAFSPLEESVSFYTRNDFAVINRLLIKDYDGLWKYAQLAYDDNRAIIQEYKSGIREIESDYDRKWLKCLQSRLIEDMDDAAKQTIIENAENDIRNLLDAMTAAKEDMHLFRTAWVDAKAQAVEAFAYSREYRALNFVTGDCIDLHTISSFSLTPYRENEDVGSPFYRYELSVPRGCPVLELDRFITHNEDGEVLLPPMRCKVTGIEHIEKNNCKGIIHLQFIEALNVCNRG